MKMSSFDWYSESSESGGTQCLQRIEHLKYENSFCNIGDNFNHALHAHSFQCSCI